MRICDHRPNRRRSPDARSARSRAGILRLLLTVLVLAIAMARLASAADVFQSAPGPEPLRPKAPPRAPPPVEAAPAMPPPAAPAPMQAEATYQRRARSGVAERVIEERSWDENCAARSVDIKIVEPPRSGTATVRDEITPIPATGRHGNVSPACIGRPVATKSIYYQSNPGSRGTDRLVYLVSNSNEWKRIEVEISVE
jgi:hypothetical protein